jgi:hypothetical protein
MMSSKTVQSGAFVLALVAGCASTSPPRELVNARVAYQQAQTGNATRLSPADLHEAEVALAAAERAYEDDEDSVRDLAYIAQRKAQLAEARAGVLLAKQEMAAAQKSAEALRAQELRRAARSSPRPGRSYSARSRRARRPSSGRATPSPSSPSRPRWRSRRSREAR